MGMERPEAESGFELLWPSIAFESRTSIVEVPSCLGGEQRSKTSQALEDKVVK